MEIKIALAGNPNSGKTTLFNALTGSNQYVGNWPGVTVEKKEGYLKGQGKEVVIQDLPGIYSLSPYTLEELIARNYLVSEKPDAILNIVDGSNIERNLYLTTQLLELGIPVLVAVNMMDVVRKKKDRINTASIGEALGCEVVEISALKNEGCSEVAEKVVALAKSKRAAKLPEVYSGEVLKAISGIEKTISGQVSGGTERWYAVKLFERDEKVVTELNLPAAKAGEIEKLISGCEAELKDDSESIITNERYNWIGGLVAKAVAKSSGLGSLTVSDKIDRIVTNRILALPIFIVVMWTVYYVSISTVGDWVTAWTNDVFSGEIMVPAVAGFFESLGCAPWLVSLIADGIVGGVGAVLGFVPQMLILFL
ncbi:MAG: ferrous iron transporter B, partial [Oscillospiraceae bacterium]|nr:ferrous iron transporter B [Oscillospiraceae bacterium]